jgi:hypothetical protein
MTARADAGQSHKENGSMDISREDAAEVLTERRALAQLPAVLTVKQWRGRWLKAGIVDDLFSEMQELGLDPVNGRSDMRPFLSRYDGLPAVRLPPPGSLCMG